MYDSKFYNSGETIDRVREVLVREGDRNIAIGGQSPSPDYGLLRYQDLPSRLIQTVNREPVPVPIQNPWEVCPEREYPTSRQ